MQQVWMCTIILENCRIQLQVFGRDKLQNHLPFQSSGAEKHILMWKEHPECVIEVERRIMQIEEIEVWYQLSLSLLMVQLFSGELKWRPVALKYQGGKELQVKPVSLFLTKKKKHYKSISDDGLWIVIKLLRQVKSHFSSIYAFKKAKHIQFGTWWIKPCQRGDGRWSVFLPQFKGGRFKIWTNCFFFFWELHRQLRLRPWNFCCPHELKCKIGSANTSQFTAKKGMLKSQSGIPE
jgi:hypothetical protein